MRSARNAIRLIRVSRNYLAFKVATSFSGSLPHTLKRLLRSGLWSNTMPTARPVSFAIRLQIFLTQ
jgi:hypothetical protein